MIDWEIIINQNGGDFRVRVFIESNTVWGGSGGEWAIWGGGDRTCGGVVDWGLGIGTIVIDQIVGVPLAPLHQPSPRRLLH